jgi:hypothetical protein
MVARLNLRQKKQAMAACKKKSLIDPMEGKL